ncbi:hypothetical protein C2G38_2145673 [Gigaspora rosea]|uniref:Uncharacterized protein n=1 Tax=Gigaspora rosea TaxID=44941 RepID=A0A397UP03_9GLOM|nr:hypothetical protein C2G38_2145673 [Gigaspora rosea]
MTIKMIFKHHSYREGSKPAIKQDKENSDAKIVENVSKNYITIIRTHPYNPISPPNFTVGFTCCGNKSDFGSFQHNSPPSVPKILIFDSSFDGPMKRIVFACFYPADEVEIKMEKYQEVLDILDDENPFLDRDYNSVDKNTEGGIYLGLRTLNSLTLITLNSGLKKALEIDVKCFEGTSQIT